MPHRSLFAVLSILGLIPTAWAARRPAPDQAALKRTVETLVGFGTRHTLSTTTDPVHGIGAARHWVGGRFDAIGAACGACLTTEPISGRVAGPRAPDGVVIEDVLGIQKGTAEPERVVIVAGHIDSRVNDVMDATTAAPGANDDASGVALVLESARLLSKRHFRATIVYAVLSGEEQGLWGGELLAREARTRGWRVSAMLNDDIVGNTHGIGGEHIADRVRVFSEGIEAAADAAGVTTARAAGAEDDSPSRALAKMIVHTADADPGLGLSVLAIRRPDRVRRGGDHIPFLLAGYPAIRFTEATENDDREHQTVRVEGARHFGDLPGFVDYPYLARVTALNMAVLATLAAAPDAPEHAAIAGAVSDDTTVTWSAVPGAARYRVHWRLADGAQWTQHLDIPAAQTRVTLPHVNIDDHFFGVSALSSDGAESLTRFAGVPLTPIPGHAH